MSPLLTITTLVVFLCFCFTGRAQFSDDFSDGDFTNGTTWSGTTAFFAINGASQLQTNGPSASDTAYLSTPSSPNFSDTIVWELFWKMAFDPSSNNTSRIYLASTKANLKDELNGYYLRIGESGSNDVIKLYRQDGSNSTLILSGSANTYGNSPELKAKVERLPNGNWNLYSDPSAGSGFASEGSTVDSTYTSCSYFGLFCKYTSTHSNGFFFDDISVEGSVFVDSFPPKAWNINVTGPNQVSVAFSEPLDTTSAQNISNYFLGQDVGYPSGANLVEADRVNLQFPDPFENNTTYRLAISGVSDTLGNSISSDTLSFFYFVPDTAVLGDVVINEFLADPSPSMGLPETEFVELFNASNKTFDLENWAFSDPSSTAKLPPHVLVPGGFVILCNEDDTGYFAGYPHVLGLSGWPAINNSGDKLYLKTPSETLVDKVTFSSTWYTDSDKRQGGYSLERINPFSPCNGQNNWNGSNGQLGGTPGLQNTLFDPLPDTAPPFIQHIEVGPGGLIRAFFSEPIDSASLFLSSCSLNGSPAPVKTIDSTAYGYIVVSPAQPLDSSVLNTLAISGARDCEGNPLSPGFKAFTIGVSPKKYDVVINEVYPSPDASLSSLPEAEFVEIYNRTGNFLRLENAWIADATGSSALSTFVMAPYEYILVCDDSDVGLFEDYGRVVATPTLPSLNNSSDRIALVMDSFLVDEVYYDDGWYGESDKSDGGWSLERINPDAFCAGANNWTASSDPEGGTPGAKNSVLDLAANLSPPSLSGLQATAKNVILASFDQPIGEAGKISDVARISPKIPIDSIVARGNGATLEIHLSSEMATETVYTIAFDGFMDCTGKAFSIAPATLYLPSSQAVVINEILFNPRGTGTDFVELYNASENAVNLQGWSLGYLNSKDSLVGNPISDSLYLLRPGDFVALHENAEDVSWNYPGAVDSNLLEIDLPTYPNSEGSVVLLDPFREVADQFEYLEDYHFPLLKDFDGVSLERIDPSRPTQDPSNWNSASINENHGTPGYENSQYLAAGTISDNFAVAPEVFSPDNDGHDDVLNISYAFSQPGYAATIRIFDSSGYPVKTLANNVLLGTDGAFGWNGINDRGEKARVGIHIIHMEVFDLDGNVHRFMKKCVVAARF